MCVCVCVCVCVSQVCVSVCEACLCHLCMFLPVQVRHDVRVGGEDGVVAAVDEVEPAGLLVPVPA